MNFFQNILFVACRIFLYFDHKAIQFLKDEKKDIDALKGCSKNQINLPYESEVPKTNIKMWEK